MTIEQFKAQLTRLENQFGKFGAERTMILWKMVSEQSIAWFTASIDHKISTSRFPPLPVDFSEELSQERERLWQDQKRKNAEDADKFMDNLDSGWGSFPGSDKREICKQIREKLMGKTTEQAWAGFTTFLADAANAAPLEPSATNVRGRGE